MSGSEFWKHFGEQQGGALSDGQTDDGSYRPWVAMPSHSGNEMAAKLALVPARHVSPKIWRIPYLQLIIQQFDRDTGQLTLMFPSSGMQVFIEGRGLEKLDELIENRQAKAVYMFDEAAHHPVSNDTAVVTEIRIEQS